MNKTKQKYKKAKISIKKLKKNYFLSRRGFKDAYNSLLESNLLAYPGCGNSCRSS